MQDISQITNKQITLAKNIDVCAKAMRENDIRYFTVEYSGSGDSGDYFSINNDADKNCSTIKVDGYKINDQNNQQIIETTTTTLDALIEMLAEDIIESYHDGYEINDGGGGYLTIHDQGCAILSGYNNETGEEFAGERLIEAKEHKFEEINDEKDVVETNVARVLNTLSALGVTQEITAQYYGSGDSGGVEDILVNEETRKKLENTKINMVRFIRLPQQGATKRHPPNES